MLTKGFRESHTGEEIEIDADPGMSFVASLPWKRSRREEWGERRGESGDTREKANDAEQRVLSHSHNFCSQTSLCCY